MSVKCRLFLMCMVIGGASVSHAAEFVKIGCMLVEDSVSKDISFKLGYAIKKRNTDGSTSVGLIRGVKAVEAICANTEGNKLVSVDELNSETGDSYATFNLLDSAGCKFTVDLINDGEGISMKDFYKKSCTKSKQ